MTPVKSSNIKAVGYDPASRSLTVQFNSGAQHRYDDVDASHYAAMIDPECDSVGRYFHNNIKSAHKSSKIEDE